jgi:hypothetical protein
MSSKGIAGYRHEISALLLLQGSYLVADAQQLGSHRRIEAESLHRGALCSMRCSCSCKVLCGWLVAPQSVPAVMRMPLTKCVHAADASTDQRLRPPGAQTRTYKCLTAIKLLALTEAFSVPVSYSTKRN